MKFKVDRKHNLFMDLDLNAFECLYQVVNNEFNRWHEFLDDKDPVVDEAIISDYENDLNMMFGLLGCLKWPDLNKINNEIGFCPRSVKLLIKSFDDEFELYQKGKSQLEEKHLTMIERLRDEIRLAAIEKYGSRIIDDAHYERGKG